MVNKITLLFLIFIYFLDGFSTEAFSKLNYIKKNEIKFENFDVKQEQELDN